MVAKTGYFIKKQFYCLTFKLFFFKNCNTASKVCLSETSVVFWLCKAAADTPENSPKDVGNAIFEEEGHTQPTLPVIHLRIGFV